MKLEDTDRTQPERLSDESTFEEKFEKYARIFEKLKEHDINVIDLNNGCPVLEYKGTTLTHNIITWDVFKVDEVVSMILDWKNSK